jgi:FdhD protein
MTPTVRAKPAVWRHGAPSVTTGRNMAEEAAVAITYGRETHAVMMATPDALEDFAVGFSLTDHVVTHSDDITDLEIVEVPAGIELRMSLTDDRMDAARARRRRLAGPTGCGLCGIDSLEEAIRPPRAIAGDVTITPAMVGQALRDMEPLQTLGIATRATHAAALWHPARGVLLLREDVGRHNALDKLVGAAARSGVDTGDCVLLLSSRVSIEMVQKACVLGAPILVAVSAPTAHAVRLADAAGLTLIAVARADGFEVFAGSHRVERERGADVA